MQTGPEVVRVGKLSQPFISCNIPESGPYTLSGQHSRLDPEGVDMGEPTLRL